MCPFRGRRAPRIFTGAFAFVVLAVTCAFAAPDVEAHRDTIAAAGDTVLADPAPPDDAVPRRFVREVLPIRNRDCRQIVGLVESGFGADALPGVGAPEAGATRPKPLLSLLPAGSQLTPYPPSNSLIIVSTSDGVRLVKQLIHAVDTRLNFILIQVAKVALTPEAGQSPVQNETEETLLFGGTTTSHVGRMEPSITIAHTSSGLRALLDALSKQGKIKVLAEPQLILPDGVQGVLIDVVASPPASAPPGSTPGSEHPGGLGPAMISAGFRINVLARLNPAGTIALYADLNDSPAEIPQGERNQHAVPGKKPFHFSFPGIRMESGETLIVEPGITTPDKAAPSGAPRPDSGKEQPPATPPRILYLISASLVDKHGQIIQGGPEAIKKALSHEGKE